MSRRPSTPERAGLEARRQQALADLADVAAQQRDGELDDATAARLRTRYEGELASADRGLAELAAAPAPDDDPDVPGDRDDPGEAEGGDDGRHDDDGSDPPAPDGASTRRTLRWVGGAVAALVLVALLAHAALQPRSPGGSATGGVSSDVAAGDGSTATTRDLSTVSNEEMEQVIGANPDVVPMRLALVERYLRDGNADDARRHAQEAVDRATTDADRAEALRYLGWSNALLGDPTRGEAQIVQSLSLEADNPDALWFLAIVRYRGLGRPADAVPLLQALLTQDIPDTQRQVVADKLAEVQAVAADPTAASTTTTAAAIPDGGAP